MLLAGDIAALYGALIIALSMRYGGLFYQEFVYAHVAPFSLAFALWIIVFYVAGLYDLRRLRNNIEFIKTLFLTLCVNALLTIAVFYLVPAFGITPRTNLFLFIAIFFLIEIWWRRTFNVRASFREGLNRVLLVGTGKRIEEIAEEMKKNPQIGYELVLWMKEGFSSSDMRDVEIKVAQNAITTIVVPENLKDDGATQKKFFSLLTSGILITDVASFYETIFRRVPLDEIREAWFIEHKIGQPMFYDEIKRGMEFVLALFLIILLAPLLIVIALFVALTSSERVVCAQKRIGTGGKTYRHYKFRTMRSCNEKNGAQWKETDGSRLTDSRLTGIGYLLARSHLDELPQLINILGGDMSFVGPRPERPEFVQVLEKEIPFYHVRHLVRPGLTGWAQINYPYGGSVQGTVHKLQYDIYYLKNRSLILDSAILIKTLKMFFVNPK